MGEHSKKFCGYLCHVLLELLILRYLFLHVHDDLMPLPLLFNIDILPGQASCRKVNECVDERLNIISSAQIFPQMGFYTGEKSCSHYVAIVVIRIFLVVVVCLGIDEGNRETKVNQEDFIRSLWWIATQKNVLGLYISMNESALMHAL